MKQAKVLTVAERKRLLAASGWIGRGRVALYAPPNPSRALPMASWSTAGFRAMVGSSNMTFLSQSKPS